jgi:hypothetical protein
MSPALLTPPLLGVAEPRVRNCPPYSESLGVEAIEFAESVGIVPDPWQRIALLDTLAVRPDGKWAAFEAAWLVARQNGKGGGLEVIELADLFLFGASLILHSAHEFKTAQEAFLRVKAVVDNNDELRRLVRNIRTSHGEEGVELLSGARLRFVARSRSSGRGFSADRIILDEAQELPVSAVGALIPTLSARKNPQIIYTGTVPEERNESEHWESLRDRGRLGGDRSLAWLEWSPPEPPSDEDFDLDDRESWAIANPALGIRITEETIERERASLGSDQFARERLSIWSNRTGPTVIPVAKWSALADVKSAPEGRIAFALEVTPDRSSSSISIAGARPDGLPHIEVVEQRKGTDWVAARLADLADKWNPVATVVGRSGPAASLIPDIEDAGVTVTKTSGTEFAQACGMLYDAATQDGLRHLDDPRLNGALAGARKRELSQGAFVFHPRDVKVDITPLSSAALALFGYTTNAPKPVDRRVTVFR